MIRRVFFDKEVVAISPQGSATSEAELVVHLTDESGAFLSGIDVTVYVDRGTVSADGASFGIMAHKTTEQGFALFQYSCSPARQSVVTPGYATFAVLTSLPGSATNYDTARIVVVGPPASITLAAAPSILQPGQLVTITASVRDAIGQEVVDGTPVSFIAPSDARLAESTLPTKRGVCTTFLVTGAREGSYDVVARTADISAMVRVVTAAKQQAVS